MKLLYSPYNLNLDIPLENVTTLVLENQIAYRELITDLYREGQNRDGDAVLSQGTKNIIIADEAEIVMNPLEISFNSSRMKTKIIKELVLIGKEQFYQDWISVIGPLIKFIDGITQEMPYSVSYDADLRMEDVLKLLDIRLNYEDTDLAGQLCDYIHILSSLMGIRLLILISPSLYFTREEQLGIYEKAELDKMTVLAIEASDVCTDGVKYVLDQDLCLIQTIPENLQHVPACWFGEGLSEFEV